MKILAVFLMISMPARAGTRYLDSIFSTVITQSNVTYSTVFNPYKNITEILKFDHYRAQGDTATNKISLVFIYGGGFWQGHKALTVNVEFCKHMAKRGYAVFAMEYRKLPHNSSWSNDSLRIVAGTPMAGSDARASVRYIKSKASYYKIDPARVVVFGSSSGGFAAMAAGFWEEIDSLNGSTPGYSGTPTLIAEAAGGLPVAHVNEIEAGENPVYLIHCIYDFNVAFFYSENCFDRAVEVGIETSAWWIADDCHGPINCCQTELLGNLCEWIYQRLVD